MLLGKVQKECILGVELTLPSPGGMLKLLFLDLQSSSVRPQSVTTTGLLFRAILGVSEAGNWPGATKANAEWFPIKERAFAQGIFNSGAAVGGIFSGPIVGILFVLFGSWQATFIVIGVLGLLWLVPWLVAAQESTFALLDALAQSVRGATSSI